MVEREGHRVVGIHGDKSQLKRDQVRILFDRKQKVIMILIVNR